MSLNNNDNDDDNDNDNDNDNDDDNLSASKKTSTTNDVDHRPRARARPRRPRVLLGITGSVAAVKGPELAVRLARDLCVDVKVLLTKGGDTFFQKAQTYDPVSWKQMMEIYTTATTRTGDGMMETTTTTMTEQQQRMGTIDIHYAHDEWQGWNQMGDPVLHIDLRNWADLAVIAPLSAHTLAKLANGFCDDTLSCCIRAWDFGHYQPTTTATVLMEKKKGPNDDDDDENNNATTSTTTTVGKNDINKISVNGNGRSCSGNSNNRIRRNNGKPLLLAPAMNTAMYNHPLTQRQLETIQSFSSVGNVNNKNGDTTTVGGLVVIGGNNNNTTGQQQQQQQQQCVHIIAPQVKVLACGEIGNGALAAVPDILEAVKKRLAPIISEQQQLLVEEEESSSSSAAPEDKNKLKVAAVHVAAAEVKVEATLAMAVAKTSTANTTPTTTAITTTTMTNERPSNSMRGSRKIWNTDPEWRAFRTQNTETHVLTTFKSLIENGLVKYKKTTPTNKNNKKQQQQQQQQPSMMMDCVKEAEEEDVEEEQVKGTDDQQQQQQQQGIFLVEDPEGEGEGEEEEDWKEREKKRKRENERKRFRRSCIFCTTTVSAANGKPKKMNRFGGPPKRPITACARCFVPLCTDYFPLTTTNALTTTTTMSGDGSTDNSSSSSSSNYCNLSCFKLWHTMQCFPDGNLQNNAEVSEEGG